VSNIWSLVVVAAVQVSCLLTQVVAAAALVGSALMHHFL
jgi:precorrin-3B methylase